MFRRKRKLDDFAAEIDAHLEHEIARLREQGMSEEEARTTARREFGNVTRAREDFYESRRWLWLDHLAQDIRFGLRMLRKSPSFTAVAVLTLALGIGANTAIFSVVNAVLLRPLPYKDAGRIILLSGDALETENFREWKQQSKSYDLFAAVTIHMAELTGTAEAERLGASQVSEDYFPLWGIQSALGRELVQSDFMPGSGRVAVISNHLWRASLHADPNVIGRTLVLDKLTYKVIGVLPPDPGPFPYRDIDIWTPLLPARSEEAVALGRMKLGVSFESARVEALTNAEHLARQWARDSREPLLRVLPLRDRLVQDSRATLLLLSGTVAFVLLIVCANVANLLLAGLMARRREIAVRLALGAGRARVVRQLVIEGLLLSVLGAALGLLAAHWATSVLVSNIPYYVPRIDQSRIDAGTLAFALLLTVIAALMFSFPPALAISAPDLNTTLKEGTRNQTGAPGHRRLRAAFIVSELALVMVILIATGLLIKAFLVLRPTNPGFDPGYKLTMYVTCPYPTAPQQISFFRTATERLRSLPGVMDVATVSYLPMAGVGFIPDILIDGKLVAGIRQDRRVFFRASSPNYLSLMRMPIVSGRDFSANDDEHAPKVAIISETMVRLLWPNQSPIGQQVGIQWAEQQPIEFTIVGIVRDHRHIDTSTLPRPEIYVPFWQDPARTMNLVVLTRIDSASVTPAVRAALDSLDRDTVISDVQTMRQILDRAVAQPRYNAQLFGVLGGLALMLAIVGIYGVISHAVSQRTHEIGIRMALGAQARDVLRMIVGESVTLALAGIAIGTVAALALTKLLEDLLYEVKPTDPATFAGVAVLLVVVAVLACWIPARRAMRVDPLVALRHE